MITILGAGLAGISASYHLGHANCTIFERNRHAGGHVHSHHRDGYIWDEGPHVSFTKSQYVKDLFAESVDGEFIEHKVNVSNYFQGAWIPHPAQTNLIAVPEPWRTSCFQDFIKTRQQSGPQEARLPSDYAEWSKNAFGDTFFDKFAAVYTRKYWTCEPKELSTDWIGQRVYFPDVATVERGFHKPSEDSKHYITGVRYPGHGGFKSFTEKMCIDANIQFDHDVVQISLKDRKIKFANGKQCQYERLISTLPLPELIRLATDAPENIKQAADSLRCTSLLLINVTASHPARFPYHWFYVYDEDKLSTRISQIDLLSPQNVPNGKTGIQVEVYASTYKQFSDSHAEISRKVVCELQEMGLIDTAESVHTMFIPYANIIFDHGRREAQDTILNWLTQFGLQRESDDLEPTTEWENAKIRKISMLNLAGRFGQWKYYWSDDCVLRGKHFTA